MKDVQTATAFDVRAQDLLARMTREEKIGQLVQLDASWGYPPDYLGDRLRAGGIGSVLNTADPGIVNELQRIAREETRLGIPLLVGRDVIHGFHHVMPIPLGQSATWRPALVEQAARMAAIEAVQTGINWTFAPMIDVTREPRWGRIAESPGEDPVLASSMGAAMVRGFQTDDLSAPDAIAACAKHFAGYGAVEAGRDYDATSIPVNELRNVHLPAFKGAVEAGVATVMTSFCDIDGIPATANDFLLQDVLRNEWAYDGMVVSDWESVPQLSIHGLSADDRGAAHLAFEAGVDMEMASTCFADHLSELIDDDAIDAVLLDEAVLRVLQLKFRLGLFDGRAGVTPPLVDTDQINKVAKRVARESVVMLRNERDTLPLNTETLSRVALFGPLAHAPYQQLGTWIFDGKPELSVTLLDGLRDALPDHVTLDYDRVMETSRSLELPSLPQALEIAEHADVVIVALGEESILSGEAHCRANIDLPGAQMNLVRSLRAVGKPVVGIIMAGRPLTLASVIDDFDALLYAWHPGTQGGAALADLLLGLHSPSGKLPVSFPSVVGQVPIYYARKNTGKPANEHNVAHIDALDTHAPQTSVGMSAYHLDAGYKPLFPFGFGLSYGRFEYHGLRLETETIRADDTLRCSVELTNHADCDAEEVVQVYMRDRVASLTRPVRQLIAFQKVMVAGMSTVTVAFDIPASDLGFYDREGRWVVEPGLFDLWVGSNSEATLGAVIDIKE